MEVGISTIGLVACLFAGVVACQPSGRSFEQEAARDTLRLVGPPVPVGRAPSAVAAGDLTGDGRADLVVTNTDDGTVSLLIGNGSGQFARQETIAAGENPVDPAIGDLDGDGDLDVAIANHETDYVTLLANDGTGNLEPFAHSPRRLGLELHPHAVVLVDLNDDGSLDLLVDDRRRESILLLSGTGDGRFRDEVEPIAVGGDPYRGMAVADLNGDGRLDLVTPNRSEVAVMLRTEDGGFAPPEGIAARGPFEVRVGDLNGDGSTDLVVATEPGPVRVLRGAGDGTFLAEPWFEEAWTSGAKAVAVGDFDGDGVDDAAITNWNSHDVLVVLGDSDGAATAWVEGGQNPWGVAAADVTGDGYAELLILDNTGDELRVYTRVGGS